MAWLHIFKGKKASEEFPPMTLMELTGKLKDDGYSEEEIKEQLLTTFGKEKLIQFGEGVVVPSERVQEMIQGLKER